jgi:hypothetical protein
MIICSIIPLLFDKFMLVIIIGYQMNKNKNEKKKNKETPQMSDSIS